MYLQLKPLLISVVLFFITARPAAQTRISLQQSLQLARENSPFLKTEKYNISAAQADVVTAKLRPNPVFNNQSLQLANSKYFAQGTKWFNGQNQQTWWQFTKPIQAPSQRNYKIALADSNVIVSEKGYAETERNIFLDVASKWLEVWAAQRQAETIAIARINIDSLFQVNKFRYQKEVITQTELYRTELLANQYDLQYKTIRQQLVNKQKELAFLLGIKDSIIIDTSGAYFFSDTINLDSLLLQSLNNRSDIQFIKSGIAAAATNIKLQKALAFPQPELGFIYNPQNTIPYFGIYATIDLPIFSRNQGEKKKSYIMKQQAEQQLATIQGKLTTEVQAAYADYRLQQQNAAKYKGIITQSQTILDNVQYAYLRGGTTIVDFLEAQRSWLETRQQYYEAEQAYRQSYIQLLYATGLINQLAQ